MNILENQSIVKWIQIVLIVLAVFLGAEALGALKDLRSIDPSYNSISVRGEGEVVAIPDVASFTFSVSGEAKTVNVAQEQVTTKMNTIIEKLEDMGIEEKDIKTTYYSVDPKYSYETMPCSPTYCPPRDQVQDGYTARHTVSIKIRKTEDAGKALTLVGDNGATELSGISFTVDDEDKLVDQARAEAIADAEEQAEILADELGVRIVRVVSFYDNYGGPNYYGEGMGGDMIKSSLSPVPNIPTGENKTTVTVTVTYEIR